MMRSRRTTMSSVALWAWLCLGCSAPPEAPPPPATAHPPGESAPRRVSAAELARLVTGPRSPVVIDVRARADYDVSHIPGAIHRAVHELAHTGAVRSGDPVLVTADRDLGRLGEVLAALRAEGRDLRLLDGGMAAWCAAGGVTTGRCADVFAPPARAASAARSTMVSRGGGPGVPFVAPKKDCGCR